MKELSDDELLKLVKDNKEFFAFSQFPMYRGCGIWEIAPNVFGNEKALEKYINLLTEQINNP